VVFAFLLFPWTHCRQGNQAFQARVKRCSVTHPGILCVCVCVYVCVCVCVREICHCLLFELDRRCVWCYLFSRMAECVL
jgi:hypothetical protein